MTYNPKSLFKTPVATPTDTVRILEAFHRQLQLAGANVKQNAIGTQEHIDNLDPNTLTVVKQIEDAEVRRDEIDSQIKNTKLTIPPHRMVDVIPDEMMEGFSPEINELVQGFSNEGGTYSLEEANSIIDQLDVEISQLQNNVLSKGARAVENDWANSAYINSIIKTGNYPELFNFWFKKGFDRKGNPIWQESHGYNDEEMGWLSKSGARTNKSVPVSKSDVGVQLLVKKDIESYPMPSMHGDKLFRGSAHGTDELMHDMTYMFSNPEVVGYGDSNTMYQAMENLEGIMLKDLTKIQWLLKQRHEILCRTQGDTYCQSTTGSDSDSIPTRISLENLVKEKENISYFIEDSKAKYEGLVHEELLSSGYGSSGDVPQHNAYHQQLLQLAKAAWTDLVEETRKQDAVYITKGMQDFYNDVLNDPEQLDALLGDYIKEKKSK